ncbi:Fic family protein [Microbacterium sp. A84]|uniref:Fic family protein n=1 Tax=Microbacterium sp. A84 TaxID=3450715 RepID=UPI003F41FAE8
MAQLAMPWPACDKQSVSWATNPDQRNLAGRRPSKRDRELTQVDVEVPAFIADEPLPLSQNAALASEEAVRAIAALDGRASDLGGLSDLLARTETVASSKVEHIYADIQDIARASIGGEAGEQARRTVAASAAMRALVDSAAVGHITGEALLTAHDQLLTGDLLEGGFAGRYRMQQNWIGGSDFSPLDAAHIPPPPLMVQPLMDDMLRFVARDDISAIGQAAVAHGQFEAIHPFTDGNGRVGRALIGAVLRRRGISRSATVPIAAAMLADVDIYFEHLRSYRHGDAQGLVEYVARSAHTAAIASLASADRLAALPDEWRERVRPRRGSSAATLLNKLAIRPVLDASIATAATGSTLARTYDALDQLTEAGVLEEITGHSRNRVWLAVDIMDELGELEQRIGLRSKPSSKWQ